MKPGLETKFYQLIDGSYEPKLVAALTTLIEYLHGGIFGFPRPAPAAPKPKARKRGVR